ncbi:MAG: FAD-dependent oxidoreductase, partial [Clostridia bacterium]|nr:FAD-dependent oxidoreductase [Clostridia bacterium]
NLDFLTGEAKLQEKLKSRSNVKIVLSTVVESLIGEDELKGIVIKNSAGETSRLELDGMFVAIGLIPQNEMVANIVELDERGYIKAGEDCRTSKEGFFVAGDCRTKTVRQVATAAGDGAVAAIAACDFADSVS